jgi:hypothetical protein
VTYAVADSHCIHRHFVTGEHRQTVEVVRVRMRDQHAQQRLVQRCDPGGEGADITQQQVRVNQHDTLGRLDQVAVDEQTRFGGGICVDAVLGHAVGHDCGVPFGVYC